MEALEYGVKKLIEYIEATYSVKVDDYQIAKKDGIEIKKGDVLIVLNKKPEPLVLNWAKFHEAIEFFPNQPTNQSDQNDRDELLTEIELQLSQSQ